MKNIEVKFVNSIMDIGKDDWNSLTGTENPFTRYEFLSSLEQAGCTTADTGWTPSHLIVYRETEAADQGDRVQEHKKTPIGLIPLYLKNNSWGEYVFDWSWANAYKSHGFQYYPKFVTAVPFTPSVGNRVFVHPQESRPEIIQLMRDKIIEKAEFIGASSWHILFPTETEHDELLPLKIHSRIASQYHWYNKDYTDFGDFLSTLNSRKRKSIRKEREAMRAQKIDFHISQGGEITEQQWQNFILFYQSTYMMRGMQGYLNQEFFQLLSDTMPEQIFMISALQDDRQIAAALFFKNSETLFGRYWGSARDQQFLHFETCYYQGQDYCIEHGLKSFDSGAQGEHKIQRGFEPIITYSNHWIANESFSDAIVNFLKEEREQIKGYVIHAQSLLPYKKT